MTKPDFGACEVRFLLPDIRLERRHVQPERSPFCTSYLGDTADLIFRNGAGALHHAHVRTTRHARMSEFRPSDAAPRFAGGRLEYVSMRP
jgi:hypothetical protein